MIGRPEHYEALIRKLIQAGVEFTPAAEDRSRPGDLSGYDSHGQVTLEPAEEILLQRVLAGGDPGIIGRESFLIEALTKLLHVGANSRHSVTRLRELHRGYWFEVQVCDDKGKPTGHIARVTVQLDRLETS